MNMGRSDEASRGKWLLLPSSLAISLPDLCLLDGPLQSRVVGSLDPRRQAIEFVSAPAQEFLQLAPDARGDTQAAGGPVGDGVLVMLHGLGHRSLPGGAPQRLPDFGDQLGVVHPHCPPLAQLTLYSNRPARSAA